MRHLPVQFVNVRGEPLSIANLQAEAMKLQRTRVTPEPRKPTVKRGYAAQPGTGPEGMTCKQCKHKHSFGRGGGGGKTFIKCELRRATWTNGEGTDILAGSPACSKFEPNAPAAPIPDGREG